MSIGKTRKSLGFTKSLQKCKNHTISSHEGKQKAPAGRKATAGAEGMRESFSKQRGGQITVAGVGQQDDDVLACVLGTLCQLDGSPDSSTGRDAHQNAFLVADQAAGGKGVVISTVMISS